MLIVAVNNNYTYLRKRTHQQHMHILYATQCEQYYVLKALITTDNSSVHHSQRFSFLGKVIANADLFKTFQYLNFIYFAFTNTK